MFPSKISRSCFTEALEIQTPLNNLINNIATDHGFLESNLASLVQSDRFMSQLYSIYHTVHREGYAAEHMLGIFRSDYIVDSGHRLRQVEMNTISVGFCGLAPNVADFHRYTLKNYKTMNETSIARALPRNTSADDVAQALVDAHAIYARNEAAILVVIEENPVNVMDQKAIEFTAKSEWNNIKIYRRSFADLDGSLQLGPNKELLLNVHVHTGQTEVVEISVVYFRTAYTTTDFSYARSWEIRLLIERSKAIKCPSIQYQLAGLKRFQTLLCQRPTLDRFLITTPEIGDKIFNSFVQFWNLDNCDVEEMRRQVVAKPGRFVLKPNLEGGGNNYFGGEIESKLASVVERKEHSAYFLMEFIEQQPVANFIIPSSLNETELNKECRFTMVKPELGVFGTILATSGGRVVFNRNAGHLLRSKAANSNEVGVSSGSGALDSPFLVG